MQRESMIDQLVLDCFENMADSSRGIWMLSILREGFLGFANMPDSQLIEEFARRGLATRDEPASGREDWDDANGIDDWPLLRPATADRAEEFER